MEKWCDGKLCTCFVNPGTHGYAVCAFVVRFHWASKFLHARVLAKLLTISARRRKSVGCRTPGRACPILRVHGVRFPVPLTHEKRVFPFLKGHFATLKADRRRRQGNRCSPRPKAVTSLQEESSMRPGNVGELVLGRTAGSSLAESSNRTIAKLREPSP